MALFDSKPQSVSAWASVAHMGNTPAPGAESTSNLAAVMQQDHPIAEELPRDFKIKIYVRSFAPPPYFAMDNWVGDNRGFTTSTTHITSRLTSITTYYVSAKRYLTQGIGSTSVALYNGYLLYAHSDAYIEGGSNNDGSGLGGSFDLHLFGNDKAVIPYLAKTPLGRYQSPDIDVHTALALRAKNLLNGSFLLTIAGQMRGDQFPAAECFVDIQGVRVFLGVSPARYEPGFAGPFTALFGDREANMTPLAVQLVLNTSGAVMGVMNKGRITDVSEHNQPFFDQNPVDLNLNQQEELILLNRNNNLHPKSNAAWWNK